MTKILFCFAGTGYTGTELADDFEGAKGLNDFADDVIRFYISGCQHKDVADGQIFPDLEIITKKIRNAFNKDHTINLNLLKKELGDGVDAIHVPIDATPNTEITHIGLYGYSRGAVTTFATAKKLDDLGIPIDIIANQPVPGQKSETSISSLYKKYSNLTECNHINSATTFLASHNLENGFLLNTFFQQMVARFKDSVNTKNVLMPHRSHSSWGKGQGFVNYHVYHTLLERGYTKPRTDLDKRKRVHDKQELATHYSNNSDVYFTPPAFSQKIFGADKSTISKEPIYLAWIQQTAQDYLQYFKIDRPQVTDEQASAIVAISKVCNDTKTSIKEAKDMIYFCLNDSGSTRGEALTKTVNYVNEIIHYLSCTTQDKDKTQKSSLIKEHGAQYQKTVFFETYQHLKKDNPTFLDQIKLKITIKQAENKLDNTALNIHRGMLRKAMSVITNGVLFLTGLCLIVNTLNKILTNEWLLFSHTHTQELMREAKVAQKTTEILSKNNPPSNATKVRLTAMKSEAETTTTTITQTDVRFRGL